MHVPKVISINTQIKPEARDRIMRGVDLLADAVKLTLGPWGLNFLLEKGLKITNDGISVAKEIQAKDEIEDLGLRIAREALVKTNDEAGDGTTTAITLVQAIVQEAKTIKSKPVAELRRQIIKECDDVVEKLKAMATPIETKEQLVEAANVSVENKDIAQILADAQWEIGKDGTLVPEESNDSKISVERIYGVRIDNGFGTALVMNNLEKQCLDLEDVHVLLTNREFTDLNPIKRLIEQAIAEGKKKIVLVARAFSEDAIKLCLENHKVGFFIYPVNAPYVDQDEVMKDMAAVLGGRYFSQLESDVESAQTKDLGFASKVTVYRFSAIFAGKIDEQSETRIHNRVLELQKTIKGEESIFMKKMVDTRVSQLKNGFSLVKVGGLSDQQRKYDFDKVEDGVNAIKAAFQEGTVPGAGIAYKIISDSLPEDSILKRPLLAPFQQIALNAGIPPDDFEVESWVRNPVKVDRIALQNACQVAASLVTAGGAAASERIKPKYVQEVDKGV